MTKPSDSKRLQAAQEIAQRRRTEALKAVELRVAGLSFRRVAKVLGVTEEKAQELCAQGVRLLRRQAKAGGPKP